MTDGGTYLDKILASKRAELEHDNRSIATLEAQLSGLPPTMNFMSALRRTIRPCAIAEFKRASPSEGVIREHANPVEIAAQYVDAGAACISVLTDRHFQGTLDDLQSVRRAVSVPVLRKDFILERSQIVQSRLAGADAVLLIVAALAPPTLRELVSYANSLGLAVLCEAHDEREVERALAAGAKIIGVNSRDLRTFEVDLERSIRCRKLVPSSFVYVAESGIRSRADMQRLREAEVDAALVGTHLMRAADPGLALMDLMSL
jgi:indole-3-glycerol phosphate synthase